MQKITQAELVHKLKEFFSQKASQYEIDLVFFYGSWARGFPRSDSDVDLALVFSPQISDDRKFEIINELTVILSKEIKKEVSIVPIFSDFRKPMLYYNAIVLGKPIYIKDHDQFAWLFNEAIYQMEDFSIFGTKWQRQAASKNLEEVKKYG